ncbi:hypothetical protein [Schlesneria sp. DSM 10557]|uniref:hypothetical protein n=1 Tax=Schlesneria sp. DSM 10557 TaxID=3044399 RepID=UPI00359FFB05
MSRQQTQTKTGTATSGPLVEQIAETASWTRRLGDMSESLAASVTEWTATSRKGIVETVGQPFEQLLSSGSAGSRRWATLLLLESPVVRRAAKVVLIEKISERGVYRDVSDVQDVGALAVGCLLAAAMLQARHDVTRIVEFIGEYIEQQTVHVIASADASLLGLMLTCNELDALNRSVRHHELADVLALARWISALDSGNAERVAADLPSGFLSQAWFERRAYRGMRRHWARKDGLAAGAAGETSLPGWLLPRSQSDLLSEGYGAMVVEWTIAAVRRWPDGDRMSHDDVAEHRNRAKALGTQAATILQRCEEAGELTKWLRASLRDLVSTPVTERRVFRNTN